MSAVDVSVVMGVFNCQDRLDASLRSVLAQDGPRLELVVVNDGSTDRTAERLDQVAAADPRIRVIHQANLGLTRALIRGCEAAQAPFIARQDAGDISLPGRLQAQVAALRAEASLAFVSCATEFTDLSGAHLYKIAGSGVANHPAEVLDLTHPHGMRDGPSHHGSVMFRRDAYFRAGGYRPEFYFGQDWDLWYRLAAIGSFQILEDMLYRAVLGIGDISTTRRPQQEALAAISLHAAHLRAQGMSDHSALQAAAQVRSLPMSKRETRRAVAAGSYFLGECLRRNGELPRASEYFRKALEQQPTHLKARVRLVQSSIQGLFRRARA
jgi:glycosyltransferase involved in cell wall biosynthesis